MLSEANMIFMGKSTTNDSKQTKMFSHQDGKKTLLLLSANKANGALLLLSNIETSPQFQRDLKCGICYWINTSKSGRDNYCGFASRWRQLHCGKDYHLRFSSCPTPGKQVWNGKMGKRIHQLPYVCHLNFHRLCKEYFIGTWTVN